MDEEKTFWNGELCEARKVVLVVADSPKFPEFWARREGLIGTSRNATEVTYYGNTFYLDDEPLNDEGEDVGWRKVTLGRGSPRYRHRELFPVEGTVVDRY